MEPPAPPVKDRWDLDRALELAARLTTIAGAPKSKEAIDGLAEDLLDCCATVAQAKWLVTEARRTWTQGWDKNGGSAGLWVMAKESFSKHPVGPDEARTGPACARCNSTGWLVTEHQGRGYAQLCPDCKGRSAPAPTLCATCAGKGVIFEGDVRMPCPDCNAGVDPRQLLGGGA